MFEILASNHIAGVIIGLITFLIIGLFHPLVIKAEYYIGTKAWYLFLILGIGCVALSILSNDAIISIVAGVIAFSSFWSIIELFQQEKRVAKGWFASNPKRVKDQKGRRTQV